MKCQEVCSDMKMVHITIQTKRLEESVRFYQSIPKLNIIKDFRSNPKHKMVFLTDSANETCVELVENQSDSFSGQGISLGFAVDDAQSFHSELEGLSLQPGEMISPNPFTQFFFVEDPNGVKIQFIQQGGLA